MRPTTLLALLAAALGRVAADESTHVYNPGESVILWLNKIGPYHNPQETYPYYSLPFCTPPLTLDKSPSSGWGVGELLEGNSMIDSGMRLEFGRDTSSPIILCRKTLSKEDADVFKYAVSQHYWYQAFLDELPIWGMVGEIEGSDEELLELESHGEKEHEIHEVYVYTLKRLSIAYNGQQIIEVNLTSDRPVPVREGVALEFAYEVEWIPTTEKTFTDRFNRYLDYSFFEHQIHWFSIFNSFMMVIFLCGLVALILVRTLNNDYARFTRGNLTGEEDEEDAPGGASSDGSDETGWKQVHGDVFRSPDSLALLAAAVGSGAQILVLSILVVLLSIAGSLYVDRGAQITTVIVVYAFTSVVSGYVSGWLFNRYDGGSGAPSSLAGTNAGKPPASSTGRAGRWTRAMLLSATLLPTIVFSAAFLLDGVSYFYQTINVVPVSALLAVLAIYLLIACPLTVLGTLLARHGGQSVAEFPCRVNALPRPIPERSWFSHPVAVALLAGILPFGAVFIEIFFVFSAMWSHRYYYVYGFGMLVLLILVVVTACVTIVGTYFLLSTEYWKWPWTAFASGASTSVYVFLYGLYFYQMKTNMTGLLQTLFYFSYLGVFCVALGLMGGAIGFTASMSFVRRIFANIKLD